MPAHGAARRSRRAAEEGHASFAHAHAAISTGIGKVEPPRHDVTSRAVVSQCKREACAGHITANGTAPKVVGNEPTPAPDVVLSTPHGVSPRGMEGSVRATVSVHT